jgi:hypothetical protein
VSRSSRRPIALASVSALVAVLAAAGDASAWCRTTTTDGFTPTAAQPCDDAGLPLYWSTRCVGYDLQSDGSVQVDLATAKAVAAKAFAAWSSIDCPADPVACASGDAGQGKPTIEAHYLGDVSCACTEYNQSGGNANVIMFRDKGWTDCDGKAKPDADVTLALTTVTYNTKTGEIFDADMEINSTPSNATITATEPPAKVVYDLQSIITHEAGHFLGLAHTQPSHSDATMYARYQQGQIFMRDPSQDDICGMCAIYPPGRTATCDDVPRHGFRSTCGGSAGPESSGCSCELPGVGGGGGGAQLAIAGAIAALVTGVIARRRRRP